MKRKNQRLSFILLGLCLMGVAAALVLTAFEENIVFFHSPTDVAEAKVTDDRRFRLGGLVVTGSWERREGAIHTFKISDGAHAIDVSYKGILPDLFREGQGVVTEGKLIAGVFEADEVLAKHDENYMPKEVMDALKASGNWKPEDHQASMQFGGQTGSQAGGQSGGSGY